MKITAGESGSMYAGGIPEGLLSVEKSKMGSFESVMTGIRAGTSAEVLERARARADEERDLRVLDAYNRFEDGLQKILTAPETGVMQKRAGAAQAAVTEVNDYFSSEGSRLCDELPDDECRERFMDILSSRRRTAINAVARHQTREYQKWKDSTAARTIDSILKVVSISPDAASLLHGEQLLEGTILRLYRSSAPEVLSKKLSSAKQALYNGALEAIAASDPVTAVIVLDGWRDHIDDGSYENLKERFEPRARNQSIIMEFQSLKNLDGEMLKAELEDIDDPDMRDELAEMVVAERVRSRMLERSNEIDRINTSSRVLFQSFLKGTLSAEQIVDSELPTELKARWRVIFSSAGEGEDISLLQVVQGIVDGDLVEEFQIYAALADGLGKIDASLLAGLFELKDNPEAKLMINGLQELAEVSSESGAEEDDLAASIRDFLNRVVAKIGKGEMFSITALRNEVIDDHFGTRQVRKSVERGLKADPETESARRDDDSCSNVETLSGVDAGDEKSDGPAITNNEEDFTDKG